MRDWPADTNGVRFAVQLKTHQAMKNQQLFRTAVVELVFMNIASQ